MYKTTELEVAAYLRAKGYKVREAQPQGRIVSFGFDAAAATDIDDYLAGAEIAARELFEAHRCLRALIQQVKEHNQNNNYRTDNESYRRQ